VLHRSAQHIYLHAACCHATRFGAPAGAVCRNKHRCRSRSCPGRTGVLTDPRGAVERYPARTDTVFGMRHSQPPAKADRGFASLRQGSRREFGLQLTADINSIEPRLGPDSQAVRACQGGVRERGEGRPARQEKARLSAEAVCRFPLRPRSGRCSSPWLSGGAVRRGAPGTELTGQGSQRPCSKEDSSCWAASLRQSNTARWSTNPTLEECTDRRQRRHTSCRALSRNSSRNAGSGPGQDTSDSRTWNLSDRSNPHPRSNPIRIRSGRQCWAWQSRYSGLQRSFRHNTCYWNRTSRH